MKKMTGSLIAGALLASVITMPAEAATDKTAPKKPAIFSPVNHTSGFVDVSGEPNARVYIDNGTKCVGYGKLDKYTYGMIPFTRQKAGTKLKIYLKDAAGNKSATKTIEVKKSPGTVKKQKAMTKLTYNERKEIQKKFLTWSAIQAKKGKMAVSTAWFGHGAGGHGDWYAETPHGEILAQDNNNPGYYAFQRHAIGGVVFYQPTDGVFGYSSDAEHVSTAEGFYTIAKKGTPIHKYILGDNGVVYEYVSKSKGMSFSSGFAEYADNGKNVNGKLNEQFIVSKDKAAQLKLKELIAEYK